MSQGSLQVQQLDLADLSSVKALVKQLQLEDNIDMLILNAGVAAVPLSYTKDNFEMQVGTNHFGHFALVAGLLDKLKQQVCYWQGRSSCNVSNQHRFIATLSKMQKPYSGNQASSVLSKALW